MAFEFKLPSLGENVKAADVLSVLVSEGDTIEAEQDVLELETDKATLAVPCPKAGKILKMNAKEGDSVSPGQVILTLEEGAGDSGGDAKEEEPAKDEKAAEPAKDEPKEEEKEEAKADEPAAKEEAAPAKAAPAKPAASDSDGPVTPVPASPSTRRFAREIGIDIAQISGTGPSGRISIDDVKAFAKALNEGRASIAAPTGAGVATRPLPDFSQFGETEAEKMNAVRKATAAHMQFCWANIPHVTQFDKADVTAMDAARSKYAKLAEKQGAKLTPTAIIIKVVAEALKKYPQFNASIDMDGQQIIKKTYINIGCAVDTDRGLLVPVIRDADKKSVIEIAADLGEIAKKARDRKTSADDLQGGTFTVSNLGGIGGTAFTPIVNWPEVAILGVSRGGMEPVWNGKEFEPRSMMPLSLSYDHRCIDGADGARFLRFICAALEDPFALII